MYAIEGFEGQVHSENFKLVTELASRSSKEGGLEQENVEFLQASVCRSLHISHFSEIHMTRTEFAFGPIESLHKLDMSNQNEK